MRDDFAVVILSYGRPECSTYHKLRDIGYTGKIYIILSDDDSTIDEYFKRYNKDILHVFHKDSFIEDTEDNFDGPDSVVLYARNECLRLVKKLGLSYFCMMDDDLSYIKGRPYKGDKITTYSIKNLDYVFEKYIEFIESSNISGVSFGFLNSYIGGNWKVKRVDRNIYAIYILKVDDYIPFRGRYLEDVTFNDLNCVNDRVFLQIPIVQNVYKVYNSKNRLKQNGGNQDSYRKFNDYVMKFYALMSNPSNLKLVIESKDCVSFKKSYNSMYPMIIEEKYKK